jgi:GxxExxY protein
VGDFKADIVIDEQLIVEVKAVRTTLPEHEVQLVNYLNIAKIDDGLLLNFDPSVQVQRKFRVYRPGGING